MNAEEVMWRMIERIKYWGQCLLYRGSDVQSGLEGGHEAGGLGNDPRELPRPKRSVFNISKYNSTSIVNKLLGEHDMIGHLAHQKDSETHLQCLNCSEVDTMADCGVCLDPLQGAGIFSCLMCGNNTCWPCSLQVDKCPFCRAALLPDFRVRNLGMERLLAKLALPCKNYRWGCNRRLVESERSSHEEECSFSPVTCPLHLCKWHGENEHFVEHMKQSHSISLLVGNGITIEISKFRTKTILSDKKTRKYIVSLFCHSAIFTCKVFLHKKKLRMVFLKVCSAESYSKKHFGAWLEISSSFRTLKGIMPIAQCSQNVKELDISCQSLVSPWKKSEEQVKITITIRPLS
uniref:RING-type E3 ubiquitin transferase n=1 Tax=Timema monikensis TaxID=170555 RepID=A0A7R9E3V1_9NEOP|nr:unnamed protein product [Timema monikensis]